MGDRVRPYLFYDTAVSICSACYRRCDARIVFEEGNVFMLKRCSRHGFERVLIADGVDYYRRCREVFLKPPEMGLLKDSMLRTLQAAEIAGIRFFAVHAKDDQARAFYERFDLIPSPADPYHLFILLKDVRAALQPRQ